MNSSYKALIVYCDLLKGCPEYMSIFSIVSSNPQKSTDNDATYGVWTTYGRSGYMLSLNTWFLSFLFKNYTKQSL